MKAYFISDIHLYSMEDPKAGILLRFLRSLDRETTHLFLMGDIFDLWVADHTLFATRYAPLVHEIVNLVRRGVEVHYFEGNHDLHLKEFWQDRMGAIVHEGPVYLELGDKTFRLAHGDETNPEDRVYRFQRWTLRTRFIEAVCFNLPSAAVNFVGERWSGHSRKKRPYVNEPVKQRARRFAEEKAAERPFDYMICGHTHMRDEHVFKSGGREARYINLGTWLVQPAALEITSDTIQFIDLDQPA
ncbi:MAG TPA: UDP-2,3-diacylglucosamine diphosphatase [Bdellovibrionales bacterium]|nr:UDP-2,3-diacylglucosamine diphosphatase [Bdellovibrionales bacterium]